MTDIFPKDFESGPRPVLLVDTREQAPLVFRNLPSEVASLTTGDYSIRSLEDHFQIERKTPQDFVGCCVGDSRARFERELARMRGARFRRLLIIGCEAHFTTQRYRGNLTPRSVLATLSAFEARYDLPVVYSPSPEAGALLIERWAAWFVREQLKIGEALGKACAMPQPAATP